MKPTAPLAATLLALWLGCAPPQASPNADVRADKTSIAVAASVPEGGAGVPWQVRCVLAHYPAATADADGVRVGGVAIPYDDGVDRTGEDRLDHPDLRDLFEPSYPAGAPLAPATGDPGRARLDPLLSATYGRAPAEVEAQLVPVALAGQTVRVHRALVPALGRVERKLAAAFVREPSLRSFFADMGGTYNDRTIAGTARRSAHAYGIAIDIGTARADYWRNARGAGAAPPPWRNRIPEAIVHAFESEAFVWGGRWAHYDTMHFEYRPELFDVSCRQAPAAAEIASRVPVPVPVPVPAPHEYGWSGQPGALEPADTLLQRFVPPAGFRLRAVAAGSFEAYLLGLPLAAKGTPVRSYRGDVIVAGDDPRVVAVTTLDVGTRDLQQCADAVLRMHAEYQFFSKRDEKLSYRAASRFEMPFARWAKGERVVPKGNDLEWVPKRGASGRSHANFRSWLDTVFNYANTVSIARDAVTPARSEVRAGDFFVQGGWPGHAVLILAIAENDAGEQLALLGQSFMPAQSFQVLSSAGPERPWFSLHGDTIATPFWRPFGWDDLRRLP